MLAIFSFILLGVLFYLFNAPPLLGAAVVVLSIPLIVIPIEPVFGFWLALLMGLLLLFVSVTILSRGRSVPFLSSGLVELLTIAPVYTILKRVTGQWPEFYNIGEHIRDFAVLSAVVRNPIFTKDPWLDSLDIYYYTYWYRLGYIFKKLFYLTTADTYHFLICFTFALLFSLVLRALRITMNLSWKKSLFVSIIAVFSSNLHGVVTASRDGFWWDPSRAVTAGITEFPSWSFVLGDLHPHYLSLVFLPLILLVIGEVTPRYHSWKELLFPGLGFFFAVVCIVYSANSWDVVGFGFLALPLLVAIYSTYFNVKVRAEEKIPQSRTVILGFTLCISLGILALIFAPRPVGNPLTLRWVVAGLPKVPIDEFLMHWGFQLSFLLIALSIALFEKISFTSVLLLLLSAWVAWWTSSTVVLLVVLLGLCTTLVFIKRKLSISLALVIGALLTLIFTEMFFLDDPNSGVHERLNTIFKLYYFCWIPLTLGVLSFFCEQMEILPREFRDDRVTIPIGITVAVVMLSFFTQVASGRGGRKVVLSQYVEPRSEGLSSIEQEVPGSAKSIIKLRAIPSDLRVLEQSEPAYTSSANLCSLSEHNCYFGWRNHLMIQYKNGLEEYDRRARISAEIYGRSRCESKLEYARNEKIGAIIIGPREKERYPLLNSRDFKCFPQISKFGKITTVFTQ